MDRTTVIEIVERYVQEVLRHMDPIEIILYGSYAKGTATENSDIDIAVIVHEIEGDYLDEAVLLFKLIHPVDNRIEPVLIVESHDESGFLEDVRKTGYRIYPVA